MSLRFQPLSWVYTSNIYEVNLRQYSPEGSFLAFAKELTRLRDMGVEVLWFMPITPISVYKRLGTLGSYYSASDYISTNPEFGSLDEFRILVNAAHGLGFKVIIDWVANHTGWDHRWTREHPDYYRKNIEGNFFDSNGWEDVIDLNYDNKNLRRAMIDAMKFWIMECGIDGFRCDMAMLVPLDFWKSAREELDAIKKLFWLAESEDIAYQEVFDAIYAWKFLHKMEAFWKKQTGMEGLYETLNYYDEVFSPSTLRAFFTTNHDENSHSGSEYERLGDAARLFAVLCCTWNGLPLIYSGQELPNYKRLKFFDKDPIEWTGRYELHDFYKILLNLRKTNPALAAGTTEGNTFRLQTNVNNSVFAFLRKCQAGEVCVFLNFSPDILTVEITDPMLNGNFINSFSTEQIDFTGGKSVHLESWGFNLFEKKAGKGSL
jgi:alpha-amylase